LSLRRLAVLFVLGLTGAVPAAAENYAVLYGRVADTSESGIAEAAISVVNEDTGARRTAQSEPDGSYSVSSLPSGVYTVTVRKEQFVAAIRFGVRLDANGATRADFSLHVGSPLETITVRGTTPMMERTDASTGGQFEHDEIERLPLNGGGLLNLLEMVPGTNVTPATRGDAGQFTTNGQRPNTNYFTVDGVSANNGITAGGLPAQATGGTLPSLSAFGSMDSLISLEAVEEVRTQTSTAVAEFGRLPGASVALNSQSGGNEFHGSTVYRMRHELLSANDWFANQAGLDRLPLRLNAVTQTFGGPLKRNRTFFFLSFEHMALSQPFVWTQPVPSLDIRSTFEPWAQSAATLFPAPNGSALTQGVGAWTGHNVQPAGLNTGGARIDQAGEPFDHRPLLRRGARFLARLLVGHFSARVFAQRLEQALRDGIVHGLRQRAHGLERRTGRGIDLGQIEDRRVGNDPAARQIPLARQFFAPNRERARSRSRSRRQLPEAAQSRPRHAYIGFVEPRILERQAVLQCP